MRQIILNSKTCMNERDLECIYYALSQTTLSETVDLEDSFNSVFPSLINHCLKFDSSVDIQFASVGALASCFPIIAKNPTHSNVDSVLKVLQISLDNSNEQLASVAASLLGRICIKIDKFELYCFFFLYKLGQLGSLSRIFRTPCNSHG